MKMQTMKTWLGLAAMTVLLAACGDNSAEIKAMAKKQKMSKAQTAAFTACTKDMKGRKPIFIDGEKAEQLTKVPIEICACHSQTIVKMFKDDKLAGYTRFAAYIGKPKRKELKLGRRDLKGPSDPVAGGRQLIETFRTCANDYVSKNAELGKDLIVPFELPKPKPKKKEGEDAAPAEGEQQASKS